MLIVAAVVPAQKELRQVGSRSFRFLVALCQRTANRSERQQRIDAANHDLMAIVQAELGHIRKQGKFADLEELVSTGDLSPSMAGRHGYVYSIRLERNTLIAGASPVLGEQLPAILNSISGPGVTSVLSRLQKEN